MLEAECPLVVAACCRSLEKRGDVKVSVFSYLQHYELNRDLYEQELTSFSTLKKCPVEALPQHADRVRGNASNTCLLQSSFTNDVCPA